MGAVPGGSVLSGPGGVGVPRAFDVEPFRGAGRRVVLREVDRPVVVLGSTQRGSVVDAGSAARSGISVVRRRSGGAAVLLLPGAQVWADLWVPRDDPLWSAEPRASAVVAGEWWLRALGAPVGAASCTRPPPGPETSGSSAGSAVLTVHRGASRAAPGSDLVCFAGIGPGEVAYEGRKVVGLAQWRSREGALVHGCAYRRWDPGPLVGILALAASTRRELLRFLRSAALGVGELAPGADHWGHAQLLAALPEPGSWEIVRA